MSAKSIMIAKMESFTFMQKMDNPKKWNIRLQFL